MDVLREGVIVSGQQQSVLVLGATGFLGRHLVESLLRSGYAVRALVRSRIRAEALFGDSIELIEGDMHDSAAVASAAEGTVAAYFCVHTISKQTAKSDGDFMDVEARGLSILIEAAKAEGIRRILYVTSIGVDKDARSSWLRGRAATEALLFGSGLNATVLRPGMIVGHGGDGFGMVERGATSKRVFILASATQRYRSIGVGDLADLLVSLKDDPRSFGHAYDVGSDDILGIDEMIDIAAAHLGNKPATKVHLPRRAVALAAPLIERMTGMPSGAIGGFVGPGSGGDMVGDPSAIRALTGTSSRGFQETMADAFAEADAAAGAEAAG